MKALILALVLACGAFAQGRFGPVPVHRSHFPYRTVVPRPTVIVSPSPWHARWGVYMPWGVPGVYPPTVVYSPSPSYDPCKKEKLKDANGKKRDVLVCRQPDGSVTVFDPSNPPPPPAPSPSPEN